MSRAPVSPFYVNRRLGDPFTNPNPSRVHFWVPVIIGSLSLVALAGYIINRFRNDNGQKQIVNSPQSSGNPLSGTKFTKGLGSSKTRAYESEEYDDDDEDDEEEDEDEEMINRLIKKHQPNPQSVGAPSLNAPPQSQQIKPITSTSPSQPLKIVETNENGEEVDEEDKKKAAIKSYEEMKKARTEAGYQFNDLHNDLLAWGREPMDSSLIQKRLVKAAGDDTIILFVAPDPVLVGFVLVQPQSEKFEGGYIDFLEKSPESMSDIENDAGENATFHFKFDDEAKHYAKIVFPEFKKASIIVVRFYGVLKTTEKYSTTLGDVFFFGTPSYVPPGPEDVPFDPFNIDESYGTCVEYSTDSHAPLAFYQTLMLLQGNDMDNEQFKSIVSSLEEINNSGKFVKSVPFTVWVNRSVDEETFRKMMGVTHERTMLAISSFTKFYTYDDSDFSFESIERFLESYKLHVPKNFKRVIPQILKPKLYSIDGNGFEEEIVKTGEEWFIFLYPFSEELSELDDLAGYVAELNDGTSDVKVGTVNLKTTIVPLEYFGDALRKSPLLIGLWSENTFKIAYGEDTEANLDLPYLLNFIAENTKGPVNANLLKEKVMTFPLRNITFIKNDDELDPYLRAAKDEKGLSLVLFDKESNDEAIRLLIEISNSIDIFKCFYVDIDVCGGLATRYMIRGTPIFKIFKAGVPNTTVSGSDPQKLIDAMSKFLPKNS